MFQKNNTDYLIIHKENNVVDIRVRFSMLHVFVSILSCKIQSYSDPYLSGILP